MMGQALGSKAAAGGSFMNSDEGESQSSNSIQGSIASNPIRQ
jgi:hypothetical protein